MAYKRFFIERGFTLIELLVVIAVLGALAGGVLVAINPIGKINSANLAKAETFDASVQNSLAIDLVGEWTFNEGIQGSAKDTSGYGNDGTVSGAALTTDRDGKANKAYSFNGLTNYISMPPLASDLILGDFTISFWIYPFNAYNFDWAGFAYGNNYMNGFFIALNRFVTATTLQVSPSQSYSLDWEKWQYVVVTHTLATKTFKFYKNGTSLASNLVYTGDLIGTNKIITLAKNMGYGYIVKEYLDDVRIYKQALLSYQIQQLYAQGLPHHQLAAGSRY